MVGAGGCIVTSMTTSVEIEVEQTWPAHLVFIEVSDQGVVTARCPACDEYLNGSVELGGAVKLTEWHISCQREDCGKCVTIDPADIEMGDPWFCPPDTTVDEDDMRSFGCEQRDYMDHMMSKN